jgi:hypothetical protein
MARQTFEVGQHVMVSHGRPSRYSPEGYWREAVVVDPDVFEGRKYWGHYSTEKRHYVKYQSVERDGTLDTYVGSVLNAKNNIITMEAYAPIKERRAVREQAERERPAREAEAKTREFAFYAREIVQQVENTMLDGAGFDRDLAITSVTNYLVATFDKHLYDSEAYRRYVRIR